MSDTPKNNFHELALKSGLFKGRPDLYFCYLKSEKIAHALAHLLIGEESDGPSVSDTLLRSSAYLPASVIRFAAKEFEETGVLVDIFELLSLVRLSVSHGLLDGRNAEIIVKEYEGLAEKISLGKNASPFLSLEDFAVPPFAAPSVEKHTLPPHAPSSLTRGVSKDIKGLDKGQIQSGVPLDQRQRTVTILKVIIDQKRVSIRDISKVVKNCSEKTIQRELNVLINQGLVRKEGERRWSVYLPASRG